MSDCPRDCNGDAWCPYCTAPGALLKELAEMTLEQNRINGTTAIGPLEQNLDKLGKHSG